VNANAEKPVDRRGRRKAETRTKLLEAARTVFARQGIDATRINEITDEADVGFGSFYNHFDSKEAIVAAVIEEAARAIGAAIDAATAELDDPAEIVAVAHRTLLARAAADPESGWLIVRLEITHDLATAALGPFALRDLERGIRRGRFSFDDPRLALAATGGALLGVVRLVLRGTAGEDAATQHAAGVLRLLGVPPDEAAAIAARPLPQLPEATGQA
jgi:AcrR family transcriptional regulator